MMMLSDSEFSQLSPEDKREYVSLLEEYEEVKKYNKLHYFEPYPFQAEFYRKGAEEDVRALIAANRVGKTFSCAMEIAMHLTGRYPDWWEGKKFDRPVEVVAAGVSSKQVKRVLHQEFLGCKHYKRVNELGSGAIPKECIDVERASKGRDGVLEEIPVLHTSGEYSTLYFNAYSQDVESLMGFYADIVYVDEQERNSTKFDEIFAELVKRTATAEGGGLAMASFTPLNGVTHIVRQFWEPTEPFHGGLVKAGWDDVTHLTEKAKSKMLAATPPYQRDAVTKGIPVLGSGAVFPIAEAVIAYDDVVIEPHWPRTCGLDIGFTIDPTAAIFVAKDPSTQVYYIYDEYGDKDNNVDTPMDHVGPLYGKDCNAIPVAYDSAANAKTGASGQAVADIYREMGLNMLDESFKNPIGLRAPSVSYKAILPGLVTMAEMMKQGKLKVHARNCPNFWREFRSYSYDDKGEPSKTDNHWMDAARMAVMTAERGLMEPLSHTWYPDDEEEHEINFY